MSLADLVAPVINFGMDQVFNALTPNEVVEKNKRIDTVQIPQVLEGSSLNVIYGSKNRVAGVVVFASDLIEYKNQDHYGGKGFTANAQDIITYSYAIDIAIALSSNITGAVTRIWANGRLIYANAPEYSVSSNQISVSSTPVIAEIPLASMELRSPNGGTDLRKFIPGYPVKVSGFANSGNNNATTGWRCASSARRADGSTYMRLESIDAGGVDTHVDEAAGATALLKQTPSGPIGAILPGFSKYDGTSFQSADGTLSTYHAAMGLPVVNYRGISYVMMRVFLDSFGGNIPSFTFELPGALVSLSTIIADIMDRHGYLTSEYDVSNISATVTGYVVQGASTLQEALGPLMIAYDLVASVEEDVLVFRGRASVPFITVDDYSAYEDGNEDDDHIQDIKIHDAYDRKLPREVIVGYIDPLADYASGTQREKRVVSVGVVNSESFDLPVSLSEGQALTIAQRELYRAWQNRNVIELCLPPKYMRIREHTRIVATINGVQYNIFVTQVERGYNYIVKVTGVLE